MKSTVENYVESIKALSNNMSRVKVHMKGRQRSEFKIRKLIGIQVLPTDTRNLVAKASALEKPRTWVRVLASVRFSFGPLRPFFCAALAKCWKVQFRQGFAYFNNVD